MARLRRRAPASRTSRERRLLHRPVDARRQLGQHHHEHGADQRRGSRGRAGHCRSARPRRAGAFRGRRRRASRRRRSSGFCQCGAPRVRHAQVREGEGDPENAAREVEHHVPGPSPCARGRRPGGFRRTRRPPAPRPAPAGSGAAPRRGCSRGARARRRARARRTRPGGSALADEEVDATENLRRRVRQEPAQEGSDALREVVRSRRLPRHRPTGPPAVQSSTNSQAGPSLSIRSSEDLGVVIAVPEAGRAEAAASGAVRSPRRRPARTYRLPRVTAAGPLCREDWVCVQNRESAFTSGPCEPGSCPASGETRGDPIFATQLGGGGRYASTWHARPAHRTRLRPAGQLPAQRRRPGRRRRRVRAGGDAVRARGRDPASSGTDPCASATRTICSPRWGRGSCPASTRR